VPPCSMSFHPGSLVYCAELQALRRSASSRQTLLDDTKDGGGISEASSQRLLTPRATPPSQSVYLNGGAPVFAQNTMVDPLKPVQK